MLRSELIEVQKASYETFRSRTPRTPEDIGLQAVFSAVFPIADYNDNALLEFDSFHSAIRSTRSRNA